MSDDPPEEPPKLPSLEEAAHIDPDALQRWLALPPEAGIVLNASRSDLDRLLLGLRLGLFAQGDSIRALQLFSHGNLDDANAHFNRATERHVQALANITAFTSAMMQKATLEDE